VKEDPEWARLVQVPNLLDPWNDIRDKFNVATDEFKVRYVARSAALRPGTQPRERSQGPLCAASGRTLLQVHLGQGIMVG
jgi:hypothetical protein